MLIAIDWLWRHATGVASRNFRVRNRFAMKCTIIILTALHVLAHGVFGCCDHGEMAAAQSPSSCVCHHAHHKHGNHSHSQWAVDDRMEQNTPSPAPHECTHASCHWMTDSAGISIVPPHASTPLVLGVASPAALLAVHAAEFCLDDEADNSSAPPLRLHLVLGVILV